MNFMQHKVLVSIVVVHYKANREFFNCLYSIKSNKQKSSIEVIVVDNDEKPNIENQLKQKFPKVLYIKSSGNIGFGAGNNLGVKYAKGEYIFFLNPDTILLPNAIDYLISKFKENNKVGVVAPLLLDKNKQPYKLQGTKKLTPITAIFGLSWINKLFPHNPVSKKFWMLDWDKTTTMEAGVVPGTAFMVSKKIFHKVGEFDEKFFLFFEENDFCKRIEEEGYKLYIIPQAKVIHYWGKSTSEFNGSVSKIFEKSRFYYFKKNYGIISALLVEFFVTQNRKTFFLGCLFLLSLFLRVHNLNKLMTFIPDQGWFYLSARDMLLTGHIPLVGPPTSHPWIHHGPLWTYTLALLLFIGRFNPVFPAYYIAVLGVVTTLLVYFVASRMFSKTVGYFSALLWATSPLIVLNSRIPYHTSPIPLFILILFYLTYLWVKGNPKVFPLIMLLLAVLYNHEITTFVFDITIGLIFLFGLIKRKSWVFSLFNKWIISFSIILFTIPMIPFFLYDTTHGYKQTFGFGVWVLYRLVKTPLNLIHPSDVAVSSPTLSASLPEFFSYFQQLIFQPSLFLSLIILSCSFIYFVFLLKQDLFLVKYQNSVSNDIFRVKLGSKMLVIKNKLSTGTTLLMLFLAVSIPGLFLHRVPIEADTLLVSFFIILLISLLFEQLLKLKKLKAVTIIGILGIAVFNIYFLVSSSYFTNIGSRSRLSVTQQMRAADHVITITDGHRYNIIGKGELSFFPVFLMPYEYLLWWKDHPVSHKKEKLQIQIWENGNEIIVLPKK